jgi:hypothetical protein
MRNISLFVVLLLAVAPAAVSAQSQLGPISLVSGGALRANFDQVSADGCEHTYGELLILQSYTAFYLENGVYIEGLRENQCSGEYGGFAGYTRGKFAMADLLFAQASVSLVAESDSGLEPVTFELNLWFLGTGKITRERGVSRGDVDVSFNYKAQRSATASGPFTIDGTRAQITSATLFHETSGQLTLPVPAR